MSWANVIHLLGVIRAEQLWRTFLDVLDEASERGRNEQFDSKQTQNEGARGMCRNGRDVDFGAGLVWLPTCSDEWHREQVRRGCDGKHHTDRLVAEHRLCDVPFQRGLV